MKNEEQLQEEVDGFNEHYSVGDDVSVQMDSGNIKACTIQAPASILGGHSAVGWFNEISGCYALDRVVGHE